LQRAVYPGSFDPVTVGHMDIIERSVRVFAEVMVGVFHNPAKRSLFSTEERVELLRQATAHIPNVQVDAFDGLQCEYARRRGARVIIRGLRAFTDFEYEFQVAQMNKKLDPSLETMFITTRSEYLYISSRVIKEVALFGGCVEGLVPACVIPALEARISEVRAAQLKGEGPDHLGE